MNVENITDYSMVRSSMKNTSDLSKVVIRYADERDIPALVQIRLDYLADDFRPLTDAEKQSFTKKLAAYYGKHLGVDFFAVLACMGADVVTSAFLVIDERPVNLYFPNGRIGTVLNVYTKQDWRKQGLASGVMKELLNLAREKQVSRLSLISSEMGKKLYENLGFQVDDVDYTHMVLFMK